MRSKTTRCRRLLAATFFLAMLLLTGVRVSAEGGGAVMEYGETSLPDAFAALWEALPEAVRSSLPEGMVGGSAEELQAALTRLLSPEQLLGHMAELALRELSAPLSLLCVICAMLLLRSLADQLAAGLGSATSPAYGLLCRLGLGLLLFGRMLPLLTDVSGYFEALAALTQAYLPVMSAMYLAGGNLAVATVNQSALIFWLSLIEVVGGRSVLPMVSICLGLALLGTIDGTLRGRLGILSGKLKRWYATALGLTMLLLSGLLGAQTLLASRSDTLGFRTARFVVSANIPFVGGGVSELLRSAATGVQWLRSLCGMSGVVLLLSLLLPTVGQVFLCRLVCTLGADAAAWLGCREEGELLGEMASLLGYVLAVVSLSCVTFFFSLILLMMCGTA